MKREQDWQNKSFVKHYNELYAFTEAQMADYLQPLELNKNDIFVDFGCGSGDLLFFTAGAVKYAVGVDVSKEQIIKARQKLASINNVEIIESSFLDSDLGTHKFTKGSSRKSLHHMTIDEKKLFFKKISANFIANALFVVEEAVFDFDSAKLEQNHKLIEKEAEAFYKEKWDAIKSDFWHTMYREYPEGISAWKKVFGAGGFEIVKRWKFTNFYSRLLLRKA